MKRFLPLVFALVKFVSGSFLISPAYELHRDEYLYLNQGQHLAWGYLEVPPLIAAQDWVTLALGEGLCGTCCAASGAPPCASGKQVSSPGSKPQARFSARKSALHCFIR